MELTYDVQWLYGAPAKDKKLKVEMDIRKKNFYADGYSDYRFSDPQNSFNIPPTEVIGDTKTNDNGLANISLKIQEKLNPPGLANIILKSTAYESSGDFSTGVSRFEYSPYSHFVGIALPKNQYNRKRVNKGQLSTVNLISLDENKKPSNKQSIKVKVYKMEHYWWYNSYDDKFDLANSSVHVSNNEFDVTSDRNGESSFDITFNTYGRYYIQACDENSGHCSGEYLYVGYPWNTVGMNRQVYEDAAQLNFKSSKENYSTGETVELEVPSYFNGKALVSLENGTTVIESFWTKVQTGMNKITFTADPSMFPTIYAHVTLLQPHEDKSTDMPIRSYGVLPISVEDGSLKLKPELLVKEELKPLETFEVKVKEKKGKAMYYTLAVVDEGLLNITNFKTPDPMNHFYAKPALGVRTIDMYNDVMSYYGRDIDQLFSIGGDGVDIAVDAKKANRFKSVVTHIGPFYLGAGAQNSHNITLPNYIGNVRLMLVAADDGGYGFSEKNVPVKQDLMVLTTLPRTLAPGDEVDVPLTIFTMKDNIGEVNYALSSSGVKTDILSETGSFNSKKSDEKLVTLSAKIGDEEGIVNFQSSVNSSNLKSHQDLEIQVENPNPIIRRTESFYIPKRKTEAIDLVPIGINDSEYSLEVSTLAPVNKEELIDNLMRYPYGCLEQRTAAAYAALYHDYLGENLMDESYANELVENHLNILYRFKQNVGFSLWPESRSYDEWLTSFLGDFLIDAKDLGHGVNTSLMNQWVNDQKAIASNWTPSRSTFLGTREGSVFSQAYRLYTLAKAQNPSIGDMNRLRENADLDYNAGLLLAAAYAESGREDIAEKIYSNLSNETIEAKYHRYSYGSKLRNSALRIILFDVLKDDVKMAEEMKYLSDQLKASRYLSTHTSSFILRALAVVTKKAGFSKEVTFDVIENGQRTSFSSQKGAVNIKEKLIEHRYISIQNTSENGVYVLVSRRAKENLGEEVSESKSIKVTTVFTDENNQLVDITNLEKGTDFYMTSTVVKTSKDGIDLKNLALRQALPSGWEIVNDRLLDLQNNSNDYDYQDIRDSYVHTFFNLNNRESVTVKLKLKAIYSGSFYLPKILAESMYTDQIYSEEVGIRCRVR